MTFVDRGYEDIVRDVLTTLTSGVSGEQATVADYDPTARPVVVPDVVLARRPVRRVSRVAGELEPATPGDDPTPYEFSLNDYELVAGPEDPTDLSAIRFLPFGRKPAPGSQLVVNYYPRNVDPSPITDVNVGSVARTLVEAISRELAVLYGQLNLAYDAAYVSTAQGSSLDRVVALLGIERYKAGRPSGSVRFSRRAGSSGTISIPSGTPVTDAGDTLRYETSASHTMLPNESTAEVRVRGATESTPIVEANTLTVVQRAIAGIDEATNPRPTATAAADESDDELRARTRTALVASNKGTLSAIENGLLQLPDVRAVSILEFPNGVPGELRISISLAGATQTALPAAVVERIEELRPAGIKVVSQIAAKTALSARLALVLAGSSLPSSEISRLQGAVRHQLAGLVAKAGVGQRIRTGPLVSAILADERIVDATLRLAEKGAAPGAPGEDFVPAQDTIVALDEADIAFDADVFDAPATADGAAIAVDVRFAATIALSPATPIAEAQAQIEARLRTYFATLSAPAPSAPGAKVSAESLLGVVRDEARYSVDRLTLRATFSAGEQFVTVAAGGPEFTVLPGHTFDVSEVSVTTPPAPGTPATS